MRKPLGTAYQWTINGQNDRYVQITNWLVSVYRENEH